MKLGVNSDLNIPVKPVGIKHNFGSSAINLPHAISQNKHFEPEVVTSKINNAKTKETAVFKSEKSKTKAVYTSHETNLAVLTIAAGGLAWFVFR